MPVDIEVDAGLAGEVFLNPADAIDDILQVDDIYAALDELVANCRPNVPEKVRAAIKDSFHHRCQDPTGVHL